MQREHSKTCSDSRVESIEEVVDVGVDNVAVRVHFVEDLRVVLVLTETAHLRNCCWNDVEVEVCVSVVLVASTALSACLMSRRVRLRAPNIFFVRGDSLSQISTIIARALLYLPGQAVGLRVVVAKVADLAPDNFSSKAMHEGKGTKTKWWVSS